jgi:RNA polymerase sigma-B factor
VLEHLPLADSLASAAARRLLPLVEREDLIQVAREALVRSAPRCRAGEPAGPYLRRCIAGALQHHLRDRVRLVRISRREHVKGTWPLGHTSLDAPAAGESSLLEQLAAPFAEPALEASLTGPALEQLVEQLPAAQATALRLTVLEGLSLRAQKKALAALRQQLVGVVSMVPMAMVPGAGSSFAPGALTVATVNRSLGGASRPDRFGPHHRSSEHRIVLAGQPDLGGSGPIQRVSLAWSGAGNPVVEEKAWNPLEFFDVVGHQRGLQAEGVGGDQGVEGADRSALALQVSAQIAVAPESGFIQGKDRQRSQEQIQGLTVPSGTTLGNAVGQLSGHHTAQPDLPHAVIPEALQNSRRLGVDEVDADVGVKQDQGVSSGLGGCSGCSRLS